MFSKWLDWAYEPEYDGPKSAKRAEQGRHVTYSWDASGDAGFRKSHVTLLVARLAFDDVGKAAEALQGAAKAWRSERQEANALPHGSIGMAGFGYLEAPRAASVVGEQRYEWEGNTTRLQVYFVPGSLGTRAFK